MNNRVVQTIGFITVSYSDFEVGLRGWVAQSLLEQPQIP